MVQLEELKAKTSLDQADMNLENNADLSAGAETDNVGTKVAEANVKADIVRPEIKGKRMSSMDGLKVLVIEDESEIREFLVSQFMEAGHIAMGLAGGENLITNLDSFKPSVLLLDQMMPGKSGRDIIREVRSNPKYWDIPIMMVSGLNSEDEKVDALELGADDYVTKPFSAKEVIARAQALVRRFKSTHTPAQKNLSVGNLQIDLAAHRVTLSGRELQLTLTEYKILVELIRQAGLVLSRDLLRERALGNLNVTDRTIDVHMASLRKKLEAVGDQIQTVRGVGYRFNQE